MGPTTEERSLPRIEEEIAEKEELIQELDAQRSEASNPEELADIENLMEKEMVEAYELDKKRLKIEEK